jgi:hypothetical protein
LNYAPVLELCTSGHIEILCNEFTVMNDFLLLKGHTFSKMNKKFVGTPIGSKVTKKEPNLMHQQDSTDEGGRVKLRGAFQGAFSAGYYNTVGSKEGIGD